MSEDPGPQFAFFVGQQVEPLLADNDKLSKQGKLGKFVATHRAASVCVIVAVFMFGLGALLWISGSYFIGSLRLIAAGVQYRFGERELAHDSVRLPSGFVVERVIEPREAISNHYHALLLYEELSHMRNTPLLREDVARGFARWEVTRNEDRDHNFTFSAAKQLASRIIEPSQPCLCYLQLGLPYNIVLIGGEPKEVLYEPFVESDAHDAATVRIADRGELFRLIDSARVYVESSKQSSAKVNIAPGNAEFVTADRGTIQYITEQASLRRRVIDDVKLYPCIKHCIEFFK